MAFLPSNAATPLSILQGLVESRAMHTEVQNEFGWTPQQTQQSIFAQADPAIQQLEIVVDAPSPEQAAKVSQFVVRTLQRLEQEAKETTGDTRVAQLEQALIQQESEMRTAEDGLRRTFAELGVPVSGPQDLAQAQRDLTLAQTEQGSLQARKAALESKLRRNLNESELPKTGELEALRVRAVALEAERASAAERLGPDAPEYLELLTRAANARQQYEQELVRAREALRRGWTSELATINAQLRALGVAVQRQSEVTINGASASVQLQTTLRRVRSSYEAGAKLRGQTERARLVAKMERVSFAPISVAKVEDRPINKRIVRAIASGAILGLLAAFLIGFFRPRGKGRGEAEHKPEIRPQEGTWNVAA